MANTADTLEANGVIEVTYTGTGANWNISTDLSGYDNGMVVQSILFVPSLAADQLIIREGSTSGPYQFDTGVTIDTMACFMPFNPPKLMNPYILLTDQTFDDVTAVRIVFTLAPRPFA